MKVILAQGNPESQYARTRHNIGFFVLDHYADRQSIGWLPKPKFKADCAELSSNGEKVMLIKPTTYYNNTGESLRAIKDFYKLENSDILVIHDELALPFGTLRTRQDGSDAGNNGVKSINAHIGTDYARIRIGVANEKRMIMGDADFVLGNFNKEESDKLPMIIDAVEIVIDSFIRGQLDHHTLKVLDAE